MKPVDQDTLNLLFDGLSRNDKGRKGYLKARSALDPEEKYDLPLISSWDYGWRIRDWMNNMGSTKPEFCFTTTIPSTFYRRNGLNFNEQKTDRY